MSECRCSRLRVGLEMTEVPNWNPDCPEHGVGTDWYESEEQVEYRRQQRERLRDLQARARERRQRG